MTNFEIKDMQLGAVNRMKSVVLEGLSEIAEELKSIHSKLTDMVMVGADYDEMKPLIDRADALKMTADVYNGCNAYLDEKVEEIDPDLSLIAKMFAEMMG